MINIRLEELGLRMKDNLQHDFHKELTASDTIVQITDQIDDIGC